MAIELIDKIKPKNNGTFPMVEASDVDMGNGERLPEALLKKEDKQVIEEYNIGDFVWEELEEPVGAYTHYAELGIETGEYREIELFNEGQLCFVINGVFIKETNQNTIVMYSVGEPIAVESIKIGFR